MIESIQDEVQEEFMRTAGYEAEAVEFSAAKTAFLDILKAKVDLLNASQQTKKDLREELREEKESHQNDVINIENHLKSDIQKLKVENASLVALVKACGGGEAWKRNVELQAQVAKTDARILKFKEGLQKFTRCAIEKFNEGLCLSRAQILSKNHDVDLFALNGF